LKDIYHSIGVGKVIANLRRRNKWSQDELAHRMNITRKALSNLETDESIPRLDTIFKAASALNMYPDELMLEIVEQTKFRDRFPIKAEDD
jgi:transcriptional regulator with XRE-family HTH domain